MCKRQTPLVFLNCISLASFVIVVGLIAHTEQGDDTIETCEHVSVAAAKGRLVTLRTERKLTRKLTREEPAPAPAAEPIAQCESSLASHGFITIEEVESDVKATESAQEAMWADVRAEHEAWTRVCESADRSERSFWVPVFFAIAAGMVMNVPAVTSLPALL